jgi:epoxyqueuosine reductase
VGTLPCVPALRRPPPCVMIRGMDDGERLEQWARGRGWRAAAGPASVLAEVEREIASRRRAHELDDGLAGQFLGWTEREDAGRAPGAATVIAVAVPSPVRALRFTLPDRSFTALIPPTYMDYARLGKTVAAALSGLFPRAADSLHEVGHACKALAVRLGLAAYGVNNVAYVPGIGSGAWLGAFTTAAPLEHPADGRRNAGPMLDECGSCGRCRDACPTGAIPVDRFLIKAERCVTRFNEAPGAWPAWMPAGAHNCIVGCLRCQEICPVNEGLLRTEDTGVAFTLGETEALLGGAVPSSVVEKLRGIDLADYAPVMGRNLAALLGR